MQERLPINWIIENQLGRRNLTPEQKLYLIGKKYKEEKKQIGAPEGNKNAQKQCPQNKDIDNTKRTVEKIAEQHKVSKATVERAEKFAEAIDTIAETARSIKRKRNRLVLLKVIRIKINWHKMFQLIM